MIKKDIVRLSFKERATCQSVIKPLKGSSQKVRRAQMLLKSDADGPAWSDVKIADAFNARVQTVENLRKRLVNDGFELALSGKQRAKPPTPPKHGSWLNVAECELSSMTRQCLAGRRIGELSELQDEIGAWSDHINAKQRGLDWQLQIDEARTKPARLYPQIKTG